MNISRHHRHHKNPSSLLQALCYYQGRKALATEASSSNAVGKNNTKRCS
jgi:hypothetical protein